MTDQPTDTGAAKLKHCMDTQCPALDATNGTCTKVPITGKGLKYAKVTDLGKCPWDRKKELGP